MTLNRSKPLHNYHKLPAESKLVKMIEAATNSLFNDLRNIYHLNLNISEYNQRYLQDKLHNLKYKLACDAEIIGSILCQSNVCLKDFIFIEYGGGTGFLSLLSKKLALGTVIYNDIYDVSCKDAKEIARVLGCQADYYVQGGIDELVEFCSKHQIKADGIGSNDVLEHIYDINDFCRKLHLICHKGTIMMHASGANIFFYPYVTSIQRKQIEVEFKDREEEWGHKKRDCLSAYLEERKKIIGEYSPSLDEIEIGLLASNTRGMIKSDIIECINRYIEYKELPKLIEHLSNTCDPYTGNWMEHLINPYYLQETFSFNGFKSEVLPKYWSSRDNFLKKAIAIISDRLTQISKKHIGLYICPYYAIHGKYTGKFSDELHIQHIYRCYYSPVYYIVLVLWEILSRLYRLWPSRRSTES